MAADRKIAVVGAGLMGHGIALTMARAGHSVKITDPDSQARETVLDRIADSLGLLGQGDGAISEIQDRIEVCASTGETVSAASYVFEAAPESLELKQQVFAEIERHSPETCILASNTSVMPITQIMKNLRNRERALGTHWWNPAHMIPLVEVVSTKWTVDEAADEMTRLLVDAGKTPVRVAKDVPGFIGNRLQHALWREAISLVERGICDAEAVDTVIKASFGRRLAVLGPLENADLVGTDLTLDIHEQVLFDLESRPGPSPLLKQMVEEGRLGMKSGRGFRAWTPEQAAAVRARVATHLRKLDAILESEP
jgi:3-hydroxybutyryl-CoA dehydrogenase